VGAWNKRPLACFAGGALLGLGFLTKMWLIVPYAFAVLFFCGAEASTVRRTGTSLGLRRNFALLCAGFVLTASAHLVFVMLTAPQDLSPWIRSVYLGPALQPRSAFYYPLVLYRDHFYLLPVLVLGLSELLRMSQPRSVRMLATLAGACLSLVVLSVPAVKQPAYVLAVQPFLYALAALSLGALLRSSAKTGPANDAFARLSMWVAMLSAIAVVALHWSPWRQHLPGPYVLAHVFGVGLAVVLGRLWLRRRPILTGLTALCALGLVVVTIAEPYVASNPSPQVERPR
jgi:hypothetical protein